jgi:hypothetical protein
MVIGFAVVPDKLDVIKYFFDCAVFPGLEPVLDTEEIHGVFDY